MPIIPEPEKREEFKALISQGQPQVVETPAPEQATQSVLPDSEIKRNELKNFISDEKQQTTQIRTQDLNFDLSKRNRLKDFLSKNPMLSKRRDNEVKNKKDVLA